MLAVQSLARSRMRAFVCHASRVGMARRTYARNSEEHQQGHVLLNMVACEPSRTVQMAAFSFAVICLYVFDNLLFVQIFPS